MFRKIVLAFSVLILTSCATIKVRDYKVNQFAQLEEKRPVRIVQISDFHSNKFGKGESKLLQKVQNARPDVIFLTGDIFDYYVNAKKSRNLTYCENLIAGLKDIAPFYYISGNHEFYHSHSGEWSYLIKKYGGVILNNETVLVSLKQGVIEVTGVGDPFEVMTYYERNDSRDNKAAYFEILERVSKQAEEIKKQQVKDGGILFSVLLAHRPEYIQEYLKYDYDLILSGHAHGGQWRFPPFNNGVYAPGQGMFPKYAGGRFDFSEPDKVFVVSRGLSYQSTWIPRIFNPPELVVIDVE